MHEPPAKNGRERSINPRGLSRRVEYYPTPDNVIERYAREVCDAMASEDPRFASLEVKYGFSNFLKVVSRALANNLNRQQLARRASDGAKKAR